MTNLEIARERLTAHQRETTAFIFGDWAKLGVEERDQRQADIDARHGYRHGWIQVNGEGFDMDKAFPEVRFPRFPADQGLSD